MRIYKAPENGSLPAVNQLSVPGYNYREENSGSDILLFDGVCNLCNGVVQFIIKRDPQEKFKFAALQSECGQNLLRQFDLPAEDVESVVLIVGNQYYLKSSAALRVLRQLKGFWILYYVLVVFPRPLRDCIYDLIAGSRYKIFGKRSSCMVPGNTIMHRFLC